MTRTLGLFLLVLAAGSAAAPERREQLVRSLDALRARGDLVAALGQAAAARSQFPDDVSIHARYQDIRRSLGHEAQVREEYRRHWRAKKSVNAICLYARLLEGTAAIREYRHALRLDKNHFWANYGIGVAFTRVNRLVDALRHLEIAQTLEPTLSAPKLRLGQVHERAGRNGEALRCYQLAAIVAPQEPEPLLHQVFSLVAMERHTEARAVAASLGRLNGTANAPALAAIAAGVVASADGNAAGAVTHFRAAVRKSGEHGTYALCLLADQLTDLGRFDEASEAYSRALLLESGNLRAHMGLGYLNYRRGDLSAAGDRFKTAYERAKDQGERNAAEPAYFRGVVAEERGRLRVALKHYRAAVEHDPEALDFRLALAGLYERMEQSDRALRIYLDVSRLDSSDALCVLQAALILSERKTGARRALELVEEAVRRDAKLHDAYLVGGSICQDVLSQPKAAIRWYERYLAAGGRDRRVREWLRELRR